MKKKFWEDAYRFSFEAVVAQCTKQAERLAVEFEETFFYPEGGGQPADRGTIEGHPLLDVQESGERIVHYLAYTPQAESDLQPGRCVNCCVDADYRIHNMRLHTGCHLLFGAARRIFGEVGYAGFNIGEVGNLYLETSRQIRADDLREMARMVNEVIVENRTIRSYFVTNEQAGQMKELAFNLGLPGEQVRIIEVDGWDTAACSGTHLHQTLDIGPFKIIAREIHKKNVTRIDYAVGKRAVEEIFREDRTLAEAADTLNTSKDQVPVLVRKLSGDLQAAQKELRSMREQIIKYRSTELQDSGEIIRGIHLLADYVDFLDAGGAKNLASSLLAGSSKTLVALVSGRDSLSITAGCSADINLPVAELIVRIAKKYGGGGGGRPNFVTAGGIQWDVPALLKEIKEELTNLIP